MNANHFLTEKNTGSWKLLSLKLWSLGSMLQSPAWLWKMNLKWNSLTIISFQKFISMFCSTRGRDKRAQCFAMLLVTLYHHQWWRTKWNRLYQIVFSARSDLKYSSVCFLDRLLVLEKVLHSPVCLWMTPHLQCSLLLQSYKIKVCLQVTRLYQQVLH